ncbi:MAG: tRNA (adenosine(37)-N6)-dimethylallyltransferase MiaA [Bacteroidota bacterium]
MPQLIVIAGPTASGKTSLAIEVAQHYSTEIISADSRQFYREMEIGTAKPSVEERAQVKHHFVDNLSIHDDYSAGHFEQEVLAFLKAYFQENDKVVMAGGSGMFIDAVCYGFDDVPRDLDIRKSLNEELAEFGLSKLVEELQKVDPVHYERVDRANPQRVIRALEVFRSTGVPFSNYHSKTKAQRDFDIAYYAIEMEREKLYERINQRTDTMLEAGWLEEAKELYPHRQLNALNTVGYKDLFDFIEEKTSWDECVEEIKKNTRRYAKRQETWLRRNEDVRWVQSLNDIL